MLATASNGVGVTELRANGASRSQHQGQIFRRRAVSISPDGSGDVREKLWKASLYWSIAIFCRRHESAGRRSSSRRHLKMARTCRQKRRPQAEAGHLPVRGVAPEGIASRAA